MAQKPMYPVKNTVIVQLTEDIANADQTVPVTDASQFPAAPNFATIGQAEEGAEVVLYQGKNGTSLTGVLRGQSGTAAKPWGEGAMVYHAWTQTTANNIMDNIEDHESRIVGITASVGQPNGIAATNDDGAVDLADHAATADEAGTAAAATPGGALDAFVQSAGEPGGLATLDASGNLVGGAGIVGIDPITDLIAANVQEALDKIWAQARTYNRNLAINPDFTINQRGQEEYAVSAQVYTADGYWGYGDDPGSKITIDPNGGIVLHSTTGSTMGVEQRLEAPSDYRGVPMTFTALVRCTTRGKFITWLENGTLPISLEIPDDGTWHYLALQYTPTQNAESLACLIRSGSAALTADAIGVRRIKIEEGSISTLQFEPSPDRGDQLRLCQRRQLTLSGWPRYRGARFTADTIDFFVPTPVTMRITPQLVNSNRMRVHTLKDAHQPDFSFAALSHDANGVTIRATKTAHGLTDAVLSVTGAMGTPGLALLDANI